MTMLKNLVFTLLILLSSLSLTAQTPSGSKVRYQGAWYTCKDTATATSLDTASMLYMCRDSTFYGRALGYWRPIAKMSSSGLFLKISDTAYMLSPYARISNIGNYAVRNQSTYPLENQTGNFFFGGRYDSLKTLGQVIIGNGADSVSDNGFTVTRLLTPDRASSWHSFSDRTYSTRSGYSSASYDASPIFGGTVGSTGRHFIAYQSTPRAAVAQNFGQVSGFYFKPYFDSADITDYITGIYVDSLKAKSAGQFYSFYSVDSRGAIDNGGQIRNRSGGLQVIGTTRLNTTAWPTTDIIEFNGRVMAGTDLIAVWNNISPFAGNFAQVAIGPQTGMGASTIGGGFINGGIYNQYTRASFLDFYSYGTSAAAKAIRIDSTQGVSMLAKVYAPNLITQSASSSDSLLVKNTSAGEFKLLPRTTFIAPADTSSMLSNRLKISDTATMLFNRLKISDTLTMLSKLPLDRVLINGATSGRPMTVGGITSSGQIISTYTGTSPIFTNASGTTNLQYLDIYNTSGRFWLGNNGSTANALGSNTAAYSTVLTTVGTNDLTLGTNATNAIKISGTNQAVTVAADMGLKTYQTQATAFSSGATIDQTATFWSNAATGSVSVTLPSASGHNRVYTIRYGAIAGGGNTLTVNSTGGESIYNRTTAATSYVMAAGDVIQVQSDGSSWIIIAKN